MKKIIIALILLFMAASYGKLYSSMKLGLKVPVGLGVNFYRADNTWTGSILGGGLTLEAGIFKSDKWSLKGQLLYTQDRFSLPVSAAPIYGGEGAFISSSVIRYGFLVKYAITDNFYVGLGETFAYTFAGAYGDDSQQTDILDSMKGHEIYLSLTGGYELGFGGSDFLSKMSIPLELEVNYCLTTQPANLWEFILSVGVVMEIGN